METWKDNDDFSHELILLENYSDIKTTAIK